MHACECVYVCVYIIGKQKCINKNKRVCSVKYGFSPKLQSKVYKTACGVKAIRYLLQSRYKL